MAGDSVTRSWNSKSNVSARQPIRSTTHTWYRFSGLNNFIHTRAFTVAFNFAQLYYTLCRPCSGTAGEKAQWARSTYRLPTSRQVSRSSVRPPTRQSPTARRPVSRLTSSVSIRRPFLWLTPCCFLSVSSLLLFSLLFKVLFCWGLLISNRYSWGIEKVCAWHALLCIWAISHM